MSAAKVELHNIIDNLSDIQAVKLKKVINILLAEFIEEMEIEPLNWAELSEDDKAELMLAKQEVKNGDTIPSEQLFKELGI